MNSASRFVALSVVTCALASVLAAEASGQQTEPQPRGVGNSAEAARREAERRDRAMREADLSEREFMLRNMKPEPLAPERPAPRLALAQLKEDFVRIQVLNNGLAKAATSGGSLDLKLVSKSAAEIRKLAARLKDNLLLPEPEKGVARDEAMTAPPAELAPALSALDRLILKFVDGMASRGVYRLDAQSSAAARQELEAIIELSAHVKKASERLEKSARQPR